MAKNPPAPAVEKDLTREQLVGLLNEDLAREYQAIIAYVVYSQVLKGGQYMNIAAELELHAKQELDHALTLSKQIDYLGGMPVVTPKPVKTSEKAEDMLRFDLDNENETIRNYRVPRSPVRGAGRVRPGGADPGDPRPGARAPDRPGDRTGCECAGRYQSRGKGLSAGGRPAARLFGVKTGERLSGEGDCNRRRLRLCLNP